MIRRAVVSALVATLALSACGSEPPEGISGEAIEPIATSLPPTILGLEVHEEDVKNTLAQAQDTYVEQVSLYSLRTANLAVATLQVSRLSEKFQYRRPRQRASLADKIGGSRAQQYRLGSDTVYLTQGQRQRIAVWFRGRHLFVLSSREDFAKPRGLLRAALEVSV